jgi:hypothetical protein
MLLCTSLLGRASFFDIVKKPIEGAAAGRQPAFRDGFMQVGHCMGIAATRVIPADFCRST